MMIRMLVFLWALPTTLIGLAAGLIWLALGAQARIRHGVLEVHGGWLAKRMLHAGGFAAMALGHVIIGCSPDVLDQLRTHEHVHVKQAERWGILFIPAYLLAGLWQLVCGRHAYYDHPFEREAFAAERAVDAGCDHVL
jgi:hypothetical protein